VSISIFVPFAFVSSAREREVAVDVWEVPFVDAVVIPVSVAPAALAAAGAINTDPGVSEPFDPASLGASGSDSL
jgi:hypothetical protein